MKRIFTLIALLSIGIFSANAQTHRFDVTLLTPGNGNVNTSTTYAFGDTLAVVLSMGNITPTDTIAVRNVSGISIYLLTTARMQGDTLYFAKQDTITIPAAAGVYPYCIRAFLFDRTSPVSYDPYISSNFDTTGSSSCIQLTASFATSVDDFVVIEEKLESQKISIYPNPAIGNNVNLDYVAQNTSEVEVNVFDLAGKKVLTHSFGKAFKGQDGYQLDIESLNRGMYILELRQDGIKATAQFVK